MIVDKELVVSNRRKADIVAELRRLKFRPFPKTVSAKTDDGEDNGEQEEEEEGNDSDYDYLLSMAIWSLTKEKARQL
jgi:DNA topoisomerase II